LAAFERLGGDAVLHDVSEHGVNDLFDLREVDAGLG